MNIDLAEFHAVFFEEVGEHLAALEEGLLKLESSPDDRELVNAIFRAAHSIKGTGGALGFHEVAAFTHHMETVLDQMREHVLPVTGPRIELLLRATDSLSSLIDAARDGSEPSSGRTEIAEALQAELGTSTAGEQASEGFTLFSEEPASTGATSEPSSCGDIPTPAKATSHNESIRVSVAKVEELINLVGELVIANSMVQEAFTSSDRHIMQEAIAGMDRTTRQLQEQVMAVRMVPIGNVFRRFPRIVRDLASSLGKTVSITTVGEDTELDKQVIEEIGDPLTHLVRNAVDHGLEPPAERLAAGKSAEGRVELKAFHEGGNVVVEISDDGRGVNAAKVRQKAMQQGLIAHDAVLTDEQAYQLILLPGFSTAEKITDISGRGVGMDVVKRNVEALGGSISIASKPGSGSCFRIKLPLTMAILDGLAVKIGEHVYVLPLLAVVESLRPHAKQVLSVGAREEVILVRGEPLPLLHLPSLYGQVTQVTHPCEGIVVIVEHQGRRYGLLVDELVGQLQVVMKSLESNYQRVEGVSGATILGDGRIALIIDIAGVVRLAF